MMIRVWLIKDSQHIFGNHWLLFENSDINIELEVQSINDKNFQHFRIFFLDTRKSEQREHVWNFYHVDILHFIMKMLTKKLYFIHLFRSSFPLLKPQKAFGLARKGFTYTWLLSSQSVAVSSPIDV